jgi:hypothetical protein
LNSPVPREIVARAAMTRAKLDAMTLGTAIRMYPANMTTIPKLIVRPYPRYRSARKPPKRGKR